MPELEYEEKTALDDIDDDDLWAILDSCVGNDKNDDIKLNTVCKHCNSNSMVLDSNKFVYTCQECGIESGEVFEQRPEWNNYEDGVQDSGRCGVATNPFLPKSSMGTIVGGSGYSRLRMLQSWNQMPYKERALSEVLQHIDKNLKTYKITKAIIDNAKILYKNISEIKHIDGPSKGKPIIIRGLNRSGLIAACAFYGSKLQGSPRSTKEIADIFNLKLTQVTKGIRKFLELNKYQNTKYNLNSSHAQDFIERYGFKLKLSKQYIDISIKIAINIDKLNIASDHQPTSLAAGSILLTSNIYDLNIPKKSIAKIFDISEVTLTKAFKKISPFKKIVIDDILTEITLKKINKKISDIKNTTIINTEPKVDIKNCLNKIFIASNETTDDNLLNISSLTSIFTDTPDINTSKISIDLDKLTIQSNSDTKGSEEKRKRGRPRKVIEI